MRKMTSIWIAAALLMITFRCQAQQRSDTVITKFFVVYVPFAKYDREPLTKNNNIS